MKVPLLSLKAQYATIRSQMREAIDRVCVRAKCYALATVHRAENTDDPNRLHLIFRGLDQVGREVLPVIVPLHPRTRRQLELLGLPLRAIRLVEAVSYLDMLMLAKEARVILTDSGGLQKEAFWLQVPCVALREETEWVETVAAGWNVLAGIDPERIVQAVQASAPSGGLLPLYADAKAPERITESSWIWLIRESW